MDAILTFLGFSLGASLGAGLVNALAGGVGPFARETMRTGLNAGNAVTSAADWIRDTATTAAAEAREEANAQQAEGRERTSARKRRSSGEIRRIEISRE
jgi:hypothetical protein